MEPGLLPRRGAAQPGDHRLGRRPRCARASACGVRDQRGRLRRRRAVAANADGADMRADLAVARAVARRSLQPRVQEPGAAGAVDHLPAGLPGGLRGRPVGRRERPRASTSTAGYTAFQFVFVFLQSAAFGGVFTGFGIARGLRVGLRPAAAARGAAAHGHAARLRDRRHRALGVHGDDGHDRGAAGRHGRVRQRRRADAG